MDQLLEQFLGEARDNLSYLDENLESLEDESVDTDGLFRAAHTLKGGAGLVGFESVQRLTHKAEDILDKFRHDEISYSEKMLETLYDIFDEVVEIIDAAEEMGQIPEANEEKIEELSNEAKQILEGQSEQTSEESEEPKPLETSLNISENAPVALENFESKKLARLLPELPPEKPELSNDLLHIPTFYMLVMDLDIDTIELGNDPYYLLSLFDDELKLVWLDISKACEDIEKEPLQWATNLSAIIQSDEDMIEDICENILDETILYPIGAEDYFLSSKPEGDSDLLEDFVDEFKTMLKDNDFSKLDEHITASLKVLNPDSKESFILTRLQAALEAYAYDSDEFAALAASAAAHLGLDGGQEQPAEDKEQTPKQEQAPELEQSGEAKSEVEVISTLDANAKKALANILNQQKQILNVAGDEDALDRVKYTIDTVLKSEAVSESLKNLQSSSDLESYIDRLLLKLDNQDQGEPEAQSQAKPVKTQKKEPQEEQKPQQKEAPAKAANKGSAIGRTVKIDQYQIDSLMDNIGELLVMKNSMPYIVDTLNDNTIDQSKREITSKYDEISRLTSQLQETVMSMRLLPLSYIFGRYPKLIRDISKKLDKKIKYEEEGGDTKLDKTMIENLADPMVHLIRNSVDHGIEDKETRRQNGKDEAGTVSIKAYSEGDKVIINIADDGAGIDPQVILNKALENQLIDPEKADEMSKEEILGLIFYSGLTTKQKISDLSGRGVGMDAVRTAIEKLNGKILVTSELKKGTNIKIELPVSVALTNVFHIRMNETDYAIAMDYLLETAQIETKDIEESNKKPYLHRRGELLPIVYPKALIDKNSVDREVQKIIVLQAGDKKFGLCVDEFVNQLDVVQKPLSGALKKHHLISGSSLLGNGSVLFILDVLKLADTPSWDKEIRDS